MNEIQIINAAAEKALSSSDLRAVNMLVENIMGRIALLDNPEYALILMGAKITESLNRLDKGSGYDKRNN